MDFEDVKSRSDRKAVFVVLAVAAKKKDFVRAVGTARERLAKLG